MSPARYSCGPCLRYAMDWSPSKRAPKNLPRICMKMQDACGTCEHYDKICYDGDDRMGDLHHRLIKHIKVNSRLSKKEYETHAKTIRLRKKANKAIASHDDSHHLAYPEKDPRAEQRDSIAINTLASLIDISNSQRIQAQCAIISAGSISSHTVVPQMPARCGPEKMPEECLGDQSYDSEEDQEN